MTQFRAILHALDVGAAAIVAGTITLSGFNPVMTKDIVSGCAVFVLVVSTYLGSTTTGVSKATLNENHQA